MCPNSYTNLYNSGCYAEPEPETESTFEEDE